jgi:hypothetical protein
LTSEVIEDGCG